MSVFGYVRVSSTDQNEDRQIQAMKQMNVSQSKIYMDKMSGKDFVRPQYQKMLKKVKKGDLLYITSIDRLGRNYEEILKQWDHLTQDMGIDICVIEMPLLDTRIGKDLIGTFLADQILRLLSFVAQNERENIRRRQAQGIQAARKRGVRFGRPTKKMSPEMEAIVRTWQNGMISCKEAAEKCGVCTVTIRKWGEGLKEHTTEKELRLKIGGDK